MDWARIMVPLSGGAADTAIAQAGLVLARAFEAELALVHAPADVADLMPWIGDGFMGGVQASAIDSIRDAAAAGQAAARTSGNQLGYDKTTFVSLSSPVWSNLAMEGRLADVVVFDAASARGKGPLAEAFQQIVAADLIDGIIERRAAAGL